MELKLSEPYSKRPIRFLELLTRNGWQLKIYGIAHTGERPPGELVDAAKKIATEVVDSIPLHHTTYGVGFVGVHAGRGENQIFVDVWANENELLHSVFVSPSDKPQQLATAPQGHNTACVWDLHLQYFERQAWVEEALAKPESPDIEAYLGRRCNEDA